MHGPTCVFWANLTAFSLSGAEPAEVRRAAGLAAALGHGKALASPAQAFNVEILPMRPERTRGSRAGAAGRGGGAPPDRSVTAARRARPTPRTPAGPRTSRSRTPRSPAPTARGTAARPPSTAAAPAALARHLAAPTASRTATRAASTAAGPAPLASACRPVRTASRTATRPGLTAEDRVLQLVNRWGFCSFIVLGVLSLVIKHTRRLGGDQHSSWLHGRHRGT